MANDDIAELLNAVGNTLAQDTDHPLDGTLLYVEAEFMMVSPAIFKDLGDHLLYRWPMPDLTDVLLELWDTAPDDKRWAAMEYHIHDGQFDAAFTYPEDFDKEEDKFERRDRVLQRRYGNKQVVYPPLP